MDDGKVITIALSATVAQAAPYLRERLPGARVRKHLTKPGVIYVQHPIFAQFSYSVLSGMAEQAGIPLLDVGKRDEFDA